MVSQLPWGCGLGPSIMRRRTGSPGGNTSAVSPREELGKNINADEAAAMGAVYQAAALSKAFKVKPFVVRDAVIYPILVSLTW